LTQLVDLNLYGDEYNFEEALKSVISFLPKAALLIIISDFIGLKGKWENYFKRVCNKFDVIAIMVRDKRDREMPKDVGDVVISSPYSNEKITIKTGNIKDEYETYVRREEQDIERIIKHAGGDFLLLTTDKSFVTPIIKFFKKRSLKFR